MTRVLLVCPEPLGHGQPAGIGIRFLEMARVLVAGGYSVTVISADGGDVPDARCEAVSPQSILRATSTSEVAVVQGHVANELFSHGHPIPTVVDLYDPFIIENLHYFGSRGAEVFLHDHATLMMSILRGDYFLCASETQRQFYLGLFLAAGRLNPELFEHDPRLESLIRIAPFGVQPPRPPAERDLERPAVLFGGIYDWYDPIKAIDAVALAQRDVPGITLTFTRHPNPEITPQGRAAEAVAYVKRRDLGDLVRFEPWVAYGRRAEFFERFALSLLTFPQSLETDLSMRTRIYDYLWGGLPIVTSSAPGTDEILAWCDAGSIIRSNEPSDFARELVAIVRDPARHARMSAGARAFAVAHQWERVLEPLLSFCRDPRIEVTKDSWSVRMQVPEHPPSILDRIKRKIGGSF
ncbi:MAG TPA: glycosyltransferase family 4 protein [Thermoanaerobaculia bacterium]|nr:glycosyltransferase family 4 protein [Thermoanaerobaculia bacterium]